MNAFDNKLSLFIPRVFENIREESIIKVFETLCIGSVNYVDFVQKQGKNGKIYYAAFIHFNHWYDNTASRNFQERVLNPNKEARLVYDDPWYWIVFENTSAVVKRTDSFQIAAAATPDISTSSSYNENERCFAPSRQPAPNDYNFDVDEFLRINLNESFILNDFNPIENILEDEDEEEERLLLECFGSINSSDGDIGLDDALQESKNEKVLMKVKIAELESDKTLLELEKGKLEYLLEEQRTENYYLTKENTRLNSEVSYLTDEIKHLYSYV
jgi:hypothetical protein